MGSTEEPEYLKKAALKRASQAALIPAEWRLAAVPSVEEAPDALAYIRQAKLLTPAELAITETDDATQLLAQIATGQLSSLAVVRAFAKRAALAHQLTNCLTEIFFADAFADAARLDKVLAETGKTVGPLHGLPVSLKDPIDVKGQDTTVGWVGLIGKPAAQDATAAATMRKLGAVLYVKTNVPQSMMMSDSYNHVFGQNVNQRHRAFISGGSSGGEASLVGARGSILGIGTDIGGSIRIPAGLCGIYGFMPSITRQPYARGGIRQRAVQSFAGPLATSLETIEAYMAALPKARHWARDPKSAPIPWLTEKCTIPAGTKLKVGYILDDGVVKPQPPAVRAVEEVVAALKAAGHEVIEWDASSHGHAYDIWEKIILSDGGAGCKKLCDMSGEPLVEGMLVGTEANLLTTPQLHQTLSDQYEYEVEYLTRWDEAEMDVLIMPVTPFVGFKPWTWVKSHQCVGYTSIWNLVDWPAMTIPVTEASRDKDSTLPADWVAHEPRNKADAFNKEQYDINLVDGHPVGVQVICGKYEDEKCIAVSKLIRELLK